MQRRSDGKWQNGSNFFAADERGCSQIRKEEAQGPADQR
jgi:hypothetical protein